MLDTWHFVFCELTFLLFGCTINYSFITKVRPKSRDNARRLTAKVSSLSSSHNREQGAEVV